MSGESFPDAIFLDTNVLLNYLLRDWEHDQSSDLLEATAYHRITSEHVLDEYNAVCERRREIYPDMLKFLVETDAGVEEYEVTDRDLELGPNDQGHVQKLMYELLAKEGRREVQRGLRRLVRRITLVHKEVMEDLIDEVTPRQETEFDLELSLGKVVPNSDDVKVVVDAAAWNTSNDPELTLVTMDRGDIVDQAEDINATLESKRDETWTLVITHPGEISSS